jgi:Chaperone of endosialidase
MNPLIQLRLRSQLFVITFLLACFGVLDGAQAIITDTQGWFQNGNTAEGQNALFNLRGGHQNTALGLLSLNSLVNGSSNTAVGARTLTANNGNNNTATGAVALQSNRIGEDNTANGTSALASNVEGSQNTAIGSQALTSNTGYNNTAIGFEALSSNTDGSFNTAVGRNALMGNTLSTFNTAIGQDSLLFATIGGGNTGVGYGALSSTTTGSSNTALGYYAGWSVTEANNVICIGSLGANVSNSTWISNVWGVTTQSGNTAPVVVSDGGQLGVVASSERFKKDIAGMKDASSVLLALRPVTFHYKSDAKDTPQFGLIAEEVAKVNPALVLRDQDGKPFTVRYDAVNAMLLNEFLKEHQKVEKLEAALGAVNKRLAEQDAKIQKVSAQLEVSQSAPQTVLNDR